MKCARSKLECLTNLQADCAACALTGETAADAHLRTSSTADTLRFMPTLFVEADEPLLVFPSVEVAERFLEAVDVRNGVYPRAFGPSGEQFSITTAGDVVVISPSSAPPDASGLRALLTRYLAAVGDPTPDTASLPDLVAAAEAFWNDRDPIGGRFSKPVPWWGCLLFLAGGIALLSFLWE